MSDHYFSGSPDSQERRRDVSVSVWGQSLQLQSSSGVFAAGRLDVGTAVLFRETEPPHKEGVYLDLGCGNGVIACAIAASVPAADVWAVDVNERAIRLTRDNALACRLGARLHPALPHDVPEGLVFDEIWSNPPIRIGKPALHDLLLSWFARLTPEGRAVLVVGRHLGADSLHRWLDGEGWGCRRLASAKGFRVLEVRR